MLAAETDPGVGYIQGMHDLVCVIFFVFLQDLAVGLLCEFQGLRGLILVDPVLPHQKSLLGFD